MNDMIESLIRNSAADLTKSTKNAANQLLTQFEHHVLFDIISSYMRNPSIGRREWIICIRTLCEIDRAKANERFVEALQTDDPDKRYRIVRLLGEYGTEYIVPTLVKMLRDDPDPGVRFMIAVTLGEIGDKSALAALRWSAENDFSVNHEDISVSQIASEVITKLQSSSDK